MVVGIMSDPGNGRHNAFERKELAWSDHDSMSPLGALSALGNATCPLQTGAMMLCRRLQESRFVLTAILFLVLLFALFLASIEELHEVHGWQK